MDSSLTRVILATLGGYILLLFALSVYWLDKNHSAGFPESKIFNILYDIFVRIPLL